MPVPDTLEIIEKVPPQSQEAESSVLGAMLFEPDAVAAALEHLHEDHFYVEAHRTVFSCIKQLFERNQPVDLVTVVEALRQAKQLEEVGGAPYVAQLASSVPTAAHVTHYARIVREKWILRSLIQNAQHTIQDCLDPGADVSVLLDRAERNIFDLAQRRLETRFVSLKDVIKSSIETIDALYQRKEHVTGLATGFYEFDIKTAGLQAQDMVVVAGRPSMGKSAFVLSICEHASVTLGKPVAIFSLEMSKEQLVQRLLCSHARVDAQKVRTGYLSHADWPLLTKAAGRLSEAPIFIDDTPGLNIFELRAKARRLRSHHNIELVVVDYLQLMQGGFRPENRQQEISEISRSLKALARELDCPLIAVSQLSRAVEARAGNRPQLSDLRESGAIEQDADVVVFLYREEYYNPSEENRNKAEAIVAKQRNGPTGTVDLVFIKEWTRFDNPELARTGGEFSS